MTATKTNCLLFLLIAVFFPVLIYAQECGNCKSAPTVATYDLDVQVSQPELKGEKTKGWLEWQQLFLLARHAHVYLNNNNKNCVRFTQPASNDKGELIIGATYTNLPDADKNISQYGDYLITGYVKPQGDGYVMHMELQTSCSRKVVASADVPFQFSSILENSMSIAQQAAMQLSPLIDKIKKFELEERKQNQKFAIAGNDIDRIKITPAKTKLTAGQQTEFTMELKDCDGIALPGREIVFTEGNINGNSMPGTIGGTVTPAKVITDAQGKAKANFKMTASAGKSAVINAHTLVQTPQNCQGVLFGVAQIDAMHAYKVTVSYMNNGTDDFKMNSNEDGVVLQANEKRKWNVAFSFSLLYYPATAPKDDEPIMMMPQFENTPELQKKGKTVVLYNNGYSESFMSGKDLELVASPVGAPSEKPKTETRKYFSSSPSLPTVSLFFKNNELVAYHAGVDFSEIDGESPGGSSGFGMAIHEKTPVKPKKITDPNSPYKWVYEFEYRKDDKFSREGIFSTDKKEVERGTVQIWKSF